MMVNLPTDLSGLECCPPTPIPPEVMYPVDPNPSMIITVSGGSLTERALDSVKLWVEAQRSGQGQAVLLLEAEPADHSQAVPPKIDIHAFNTGEVKVEHIKVQEVEIATGQVISTGTLEEIRAMFKTKKSGA